MLEIKHSKLGKWVFFGDFNVVRQPKERVNSAFYPASASTFKSFIQDVELHDFNMDGEKYTYMARVDAKLSKLDRFLACDFLEDFPSLVITAHQRELSDDCPITMISYASDYRPPPFKLFNSWMLKDGFETTVKVAWINIVGFGEPDVYLGVKLKYLKEEVKKWKKNIEKTEKQEISILDYIYAGDTCSKLTRIFKLHCLKHIIDSMGRVGSVLG